MIPKQIKKWVEAVEAEQMERLNELLADDVRVFNGSNTKMRHGHVILKMYLTGASRVSIRYTKVFCKGNLAILQFKFVINGVQMESTKRLYWDKQQKFTEIHIGYATEVN